MQHWEEYFAPIDNHIIAEEFERSRLGAQIQYFGGGNDFPWDESSKPDIVIIGAGYDSSDLSANFNATPDHVRYYLYRLFKGNYTIKVSDFGNFSLNRNLDEVCNYLSDIFAELMAQDITPLIIGGGKEIAYAMYLAYKKMDQYVNLLDVSSYIHFKDTEEELTAENYLGKILSDPESYLFNYSNLGYQTYFTAPELIELFKNFNFEMYRLGEVRSHIENAEPIIRDSNFAVFDIGSVKHGDVPHATFSTPNGFLTDEICRLARYAGLTSKISSIGFFGLEPGMKREWQDSHLVAQVIWHFIEGFYVRKPETLDVNDERYVKFHVTYQEYPHEIVFYKNTYTEKWWMGVPISDHSKFKIKEYFVPCSESDYQTAAFNEIPDRWIRIHKKLNES